MDSGLHVRSGPARQTFGPFTIDADRVEVTHGGVTVPLRAKTFTLLLHLVDRAGNVVSKQELIDVVWPGVIVTDDSLTQAVHELRGALGDHGQSLIRTVLRRGYRLDATVSPVPARAASLSASLSAPLPAAPSPPVRRRLRWGAALFGALSIGAIVWVLVPAEWPKPARIGTALAERRSLAVVPFTDLSDPPAPHLALAVDTDLTTDLGRLPDTRVIARGSTAVLGTSASVDVKRVGRELDVRHVVMGSVRRDGERLHITVQLVRTDSGALLRSERFDYSSAADWVTQRDVSVRIANWLDMQVRDATLRDAPPRKADNAAVERWMRGHYILMRARTRAELLQARTEFEAALAAQPDSNHALAGLARTYHDEVLNRWTHERNAALQTAEKLSRQAVEIDPSHQDSLAQLSRSLTLNGKLDEAMVVIRRRLVINPTDPHAVRDLATVVYFFGRWEEALQHAETALRLSPLDRLNTGNANLLVATALVALRRYDEAVERAQLVVDPPRGPAHLTLASAEALRGNLDAARIHAAAALKRDPSLTISRFAASRGSTAPLFIAGMEHFQSGMRLAGVPE